MMKFTVKECSDKAGVSVKTVHNYIKAGKISSEKNTSGVIVIDPLHEESKYWSLL